MKRFHRLLKDKTCKPSFKKRPKNLSKPPASQKFALFEFFSYAHFCSDCQAKGITWNKMFIIMNSRANSIFVVKSSEFEVSEFFQKTSS